MNSKLSSSSTPYYQEIELFSSLQKRIDDQELLIQLKKIEGNYYQLFQPNNNRNINRKITSEKGSTVTLTNFNKQWQKVYEDCQIYFYNETLNFYYSDIKRCISKIHEVFLRFSSADSFPRVSKKKSYDRRYDEFDSSNDEESNYEQCVTAFKEEFLKLKQIFNLKQYSQNFLNEFKKFLKKVPKYISIFSEANINQEELSSLISIMQKKSNQIGEFISSIEQTLIPNELIELDEIICQKIEENNRKGEKDQLDADDGRSHLRKSEFVRNQNNLSPAKNVQKASNSFRQTYSNSKNILNKDQIHSKNGRTTTQREILIDINSCSNRLKSISSSIDSKLDEESNSETKNKKMLKFLQLIQSQIDSECRFLNTIQKAEIIPENDQNNSELQNERQRNKMIFEILNKGQSALIEDIDTEKLKKLNNNQLISIILTLCQMIKESNNNGENMKKNYKLQIPLELTFCHGTPEEFKRLSQQFIDTARYNEWAESKIKKLSLTNVQLQSENEILSSQIASKETEYKLLNELRKTNERIQIINSALEQKLQADSKRPTPSLETSELNTEVEDLIKKKKKIKNNLKQIIPNEMLNEIDSLNKVNAKLQCIAEARMKENEDLQKQILEFSTQAAKNNRNDEMQANRLFENNQNRSYGKMKNEFNDIPNEYSDDDFIRKQSNQFYNGQNNSFSNKRNQNDRFEENDQQENFINRSENPPYKMNRGNQTSFIDDQQENFINRSENPPYKMNQNNFIDDQQEYFNRNENLSKRSNRRNQNSFDDDQQENFNRNENLSKRSNRSNQNSFIDDQQENFNRNENLSKRSNRSNQNSYIDDQQENFNRNENLSKKSNRRNQNNFDDDQQENFNRNENLPKRSNRSNQNSFDDDQQENFANVRKSGKISRSTYDQNETVNNRNFSPTAKSSRLNRNNQINNNISDSYINRMNNSPNRNTKINRNSNYEVGKKLLKNNYQDQNFTNSRNSTQRKNQINRNNAQIIEEEEEEIDEVDDNRNQGTNSNEIDNEIQDYLGNRNLARNSRFDDDEDDDFYQKKSQKKNNPRMRK